jgi:hypothetical protein
MHGFDSAYMCTQSEMAWDLGRPLTPSRAGRIVNAVTNIGWSVALLAGLFWMWAGWSVSEIYRQTDLQHTEQQAALKSAMASLAPEPYPKALEALQKAVEQAARDGGTLVQFEHKGSRSTWTLSVEGQLVQGSFN